MNELHDLAPLYALDALDDLDRVRFVRHLATCEECRSAVQALQESAADLSELTAEAPPPELRARILDRLDGVPQQPATSAAGSRRSWLAGIAASVAVVTALGLGWWVSQGPDRLIDSVLEDPEAITVMAQPTPEGQTVVSSARVVFDPDQAVAVLVAEGLSSLGEDQVYELWIIADAEPQPAGLFRPDDEGRAVVLIEGEVPPGAVVALTIEPEGGSERPTGDVLFLAEV